MHDIVSDPKYEAVAEEVMLLRRQQEEARQTLVQGQMPDPLSAEDMNYM